MSEVKIKVIDLLQDIKADFNRSQKEIKDDILIIKKDLAKNTLTAMENKIKLALFTTGGGVIGGIIVTVGVEVVKKIIEGKS